jgi:hypothetical protein
MGSLLKLLASLRLTVVGLFLLLVLTVWGTLYQAEFGLYRAQERFYQTWYFLAGNLIPFPGAKLVMTILIVNLAAALLWLAIRRRLRLGLLVTHAGLLLMLVAGGVTFYLGEESMLTLVEGEGSNVATSDRHWELALWRADAGLERDVQALDIRSLRPGQTLALPVGGGTLTIEDYAEHAEVRRGDGVEPALVHKPPTTEPSQSRPGLVATLAGGDAPAQSLLLWGGDAETRPTPVKLGGVDYLMNLRPRRTVMPVLIQLLDFRKVEYPGSAMARSYSSQVIVGGAQSLERKVTISMNKPLRIEGFTFYQASYHELQGGREASTFSVVKNYARTMPYVATGLTFVGMILHFMGMLLTRQRQPRAGEGATS